MTEQTKPAKKRIAVDGWGLYMGLLVLLLFVADLAISLMATGSVDQSVTFGVGRWVTDLIDAIGNEGSQP
jgi:hypothetical protein